MVTDHFCEDELQCPCCGQLDMDEYFTASFEKARILADIPFVISSGFRCEKHNKEVGGKVDSAHLKGCAADILIHDSRSRFITLRALLDAGFVRIGESDVDIHGNNFIHVDSDESKARFVKWGY